MAMRHTTTPAGGSAPEPTVGRRAWQATRWWVRQLAGEGKYDAYLAHHRARHPGVAPMSEREFWRDEYAKQAANPGSRCC